MALKQLALILLVILLGAIYPIGTVFATQPSDQLAFGSGGAHDCSVIARTNVTAPMIILCSITPSDDTYADKLIPTKAFGELGVLIVQNVPSVPVSKTYAFMKFDLSTSLPAELTRVWARPLNASLGMYVRLMNFFYNSTVEVHNSPAENWTEGSLTWNNMPEFEANNYVSTNIRQNGTWARWNVSGLIRQQFNSTGQVAFAAISSETSWRNLVWFDSKEHPSSNGSTTPTLELIFVEPFLTVETPYPKTSISVAGRAIITNANGTAQLMLPWGNYPLSVPDIITMGNGTRARFVNWSDASNSSTRFVSLGNNLTLRANYGIQHELDTYSPFGTVIGGGWYFENSDATITIIPTSVPLGGFMGWIGGRYIFDHWTGVCSTTASQCNLLMDNPKNAVAVWKVDWTLTIIFAIILVVSSVCVSVLRKGRYLEKRSKTSKKWSRQLHGRRRYYRELCKLTSLVL